MQVLKELILVTPVKFNSSTILGLKCGILLGDCWTHVKEIPNTKLLVSLYHYSNDAVNMAVFDISKKDQIKEIYSLGEVSGGRIIIVLSFIV